MVQWLVVGGNVANVAMWQARHGSLERVDLVERGEYPKLGDSHLNQLIPICC